MTPIITKYEEATPALRFVIRDGKRMLQQRWIYKEIVDRKPIKQLLEWRDVPLEAE